MPELPTTDDTMIGALITAVSSYFDRFTGRTFSPEAATLRIFSGDGTNRIILSPPLASAPTLVRVRANASDVWRTVTAGDVRLMPEGRKTGDPILWLELSDAPTGIEYLWPEALDTVEITGTWGITATPPEIKEACLETVVNLYRARGSAGSDMEVGVGGTFMPDVAKAMPLMAYKILQSYKRFVVA